MKLWINNFQAHLVIGGWCAFCKLPLYECHWILLIVSQHWFRYHYLSQPWPRTESLYRVTKRQWVIYCWQRPWNATMTSSNGNIFRVTGHLCGEFTGPGEFLTQRPVTRSFDVFFDLRLNKRLSKQPWGWWFETPSWSLSRHCNAVIRCASYWGVVSLHKVLFRIAVIRNLDSKVHGVNKGPI